MMFSSNSKLFKASGSRKLAALLLLTLLSTFVVIPDAEAACPGSFTALGNLVELESCTETQQASGVTNINLAVPAGVVEGDLLIAAVAKDDDEVINTPAGWAVVNQRIIGNNDGYLSVFFRVADGSELPNYNFSWTSNEEAYAYMMRFTDASGQILSATNWGNTGTAQAPSIITEVLDTLIVRIVGWDDDDEANDPAVIVAGHTNITQDQSGGGNGTVSGGAAYVNQPAVGASGTANFAAGNEQWATMTLGLEPIEFHIALGGATSTTCGIQQVTLSVTNKNGIPMPWFRGTATITASNATSATWSDAGAANAINDLGNGTATYTFAAGDGGTATFDFFNPNLGITNFDIEYRGFTNIEQPDFDPDLTINPCPPPTEIRLSHSTEADVCSLEAITIAVTDAAGNLGGNYTGIITITNSTGAGTWSVNDAANPGSLVDNGSGSVSYTFVAGDQGDIVLNYALTSANAAVDFDVTASGLTSPVAPNDPALEIVNCKAIIDVDPTTTPNTLNVCSASVTTRLTILNRDDGVPNGTIGVVTLRSTPTLPGPTVGDFISVTNPGTDTGTLSNGAPGDGIATYAFDPGEDNVVDIEFSTNYEGDLNIDSFSTYIDFQSGASDQLLSVYGCEFRISISGNTDVCSIAQVTIDVFNTNGDDIDDYVGTVNLSQDNGVGGTWSDPGNDPGQPQGNLTETVPENAGAATYEFVLADGGQVTLDYTNQTNETVNFEVSDGTSSASNGSFDPNMIVSLCTFRIALTDGIANACSFEDVTISVFDSGDGPASNYAGTVTLSTDTLTGSWSNTGVPADAENVPDNSLGGNTNNGQATYEFVTGDGGDVTLRFTHDTPGTVNINAIAGVIEVDGAFDPSLDVSGCIPEVADFACYSGANIGTDTRQIDVGISDPGRMILMLIFHSDVTPTTTDITAATLGGEAMSQIREQRGINTGVEMWGITNAGIDAGGLTGLQIGAYTEATPDATFFGSMCLVRLTDVDQNFPAEDLGTPSQGQVNSNSFVPDGAPLEMATSITTSANNALVLSAGVSDFTQDPNSWWNDVDPNPPMAQLFFNNNNQNPVGGTAGGSVGNKAVAGFITVTDIDIQDATTSASHIVASFNPRVAGAPEAVGFEPVVLVKTLSGNQEYRAIGNTMRSASNTAGGACSFSPSAAATSSSSTLNMPPGSTVETAYLYWSGSGEQFEADNTVDFGPTAGTLTSITADDMFYIDNVGGGGNLDYFAGFKDVTSIVAANGSVSYTLGALEVQNNTPWSDTQACAGGWAMIVVYNNSQERFRVTNLFHGFQPFQNSAFTQVPRNFRMATTDAVELLPNGQITHVTIEGDETLASGDESLGIQSAPGLETFNTLSNSFNPLQADFNSTVSRPIFAIGGTGFYEFQSGAGVNGDGYEEDTGPGTNNPPELGSSWGFDVDTHYVSGDTSAGVLWNFAQPGAEAEEITTRYSSGQDLVMLIADAISVTNFDLADLEIFKGQSGAFKVNTTAGGTYTFTVTNNGNGGISGGQASGRVLVADVMPAGLTINNISGTAWSCNVSIGNDAFICEFNIGADCDVANSCGSTDNELLGGESLPVLTASIDVGDTSFFPLLSNNVKNAGRMQHNGGSCPPLTPGVIPDPDTCARSPQYDNVNDLQGGSVDINDLDDKTTENNNVDSVITEVRGVETDLGITKSVDGILEEGETGSYTLTVTNFGPDATTGAAGGTITVTDTKPPGVTFTAVSGSGWNCPGSAFPCTYTGALAVSSSATITVNVNVTGAAGQNVTNTAAVSSGTFNFDSNTGNDSATDITAIVAPPVSSNDKFLLSVSVPTNTTEIGGLTAPDDIKNEDLFLYDPLIDVATEFYVNADAAPTYDINDANAVHLFKNGHVALSSETGGTIGASATAFQAEDIVVWDPIQDEYVETLFDGTTLLDGGSIADNNIDAVYVKDNGNILFSTAGATSITTTGSGTVSFQPGDIVEYDPVGLTATIVFDSSASNLFNAEVQVDGLYLRVDPADPDSNEDKFILSVNESPSVNVGECPGCDPVGGTFLGRDDIVEVDLTGADPVTQNLFVGDIPLGVFAPTNNDREIDAIHVVEDAYLGHFAITQSQAGSTCEAGQITISKHKGLTHDVDTDYTGSIRISTDLVIGDWAVSVGNGTLVNGTAGDGEAIYTFVPTDNGEVTLFLTVDTVNTINVDVTNNFAGFVGELGSEDPNFVFNNVITNVTYRDEFGAASYDNDDGSTFWLGDWVEGGGEADGAAAGNILINAGQLEITASPGIPNPSLQRTANLNLYTVTQAVLLNYDYTYQFINGGSDVLEVQVSTDGSAWTTVREYGAGDIAISGTNLTPQSESIDVTAAFGIVPPASGPATAYVRFLVSGGYTGTSRMFFDNVELATGTTDCGIGSIDHYEIRIDGITGTSATLVPGIQCVGSVVTITGHDLSDFPSAANETITLSTTSTGPSNGGDWTLLSGNGLLSNGTLGDGIATYAFAPGEQSVSLIFNYTAPAAEDEQVNINVSASHPVLVSEDPTLQVDLAGLLFYNETANNPVNISPIPTQIAGKPSNVLPDIRLITIEAVRTSDNDPQACSPLFDAGNTPTIGFAAECIDPAGCSASLTDQFQINGTAMTPAPDDTDPNTTSASFVDVTVPLVDQGAGRIGGNLVFSYADSGSIQIHAEYEIPLGNNPAGTLSGDSLTGVSNVFVVRPFGFDLDFSDDRFLNGLGGSSYAADANGTRFAIAEAPFDATVTAVLWQSEDDDDLVEGNDGIPDQGANLSNNARTPNYGNESTAADYDVLVSLNQIVAPTSTVGALSNNLFTNVDEGFQLQSMRFDEVGIIDLDITLVDSADGTTPIGFMGTGNILRGNLKNVGRFYPQDFQIYGTPRVIPRPLADAEPYAIGMSTFTYMGENFGLSVPVRARNVDGEVTRNYIGDFAKLGDGINDFSADKFFAVEVLPGAGDDNNLSSRIAFGNPLWSTNPSISWNSNPQVDGGEGLITGNLVFERQTSGEQDGPYEDLTIAINTQDSDTVPFVLDLDIDDAVGDDAAIIDTAEFRYGRLLIDEAFGSELDPVGITFRVEYWDGTDFVLNTDDSSTTIFYDASENVSANRSLRWVGGTFQDNLVEDDNDIAEPGESFLELAAIQADTDVTRSIYQGQTLFRSNVDLDTDGFQDDSPIFASAPGEGFEGSAIVEFNLNDASLPFSLDFLSYDWRGGGVDEYDEIPDGVDYDDNPRSVVNFGSYRGHDRIINWQEIYIGPSD